MSLKKGLFDDWSCDLWRQMSFLYWAKKSPYHWLAPNSLHISEASQPSFAQIKGMEFRNKLLNHWEEIPFFNTTDNETQGPIVQQTWFVKGSHISLKDGV